MITHILTILMVVMGVLGGAGAGTVYASQSSMPDDILYPVKIWSEDAQLELTGQVDSELLLQLKYAERRIEEMQALLDEGETLPLSLKTRLEYHLAQASMLAGQTEEPLRSMEQVANQLHIHQQLMSGYADEPVLRQTREMIQLRLQSMDCSDDGCQYGEMNGQDQDPAQQKNQEMQQKGAQENNNPAGETEPIQDQTQDQIRDQQQLHQEDGPIEEPVQQQDRTQNQGQDQKRDPATHDED